MTDLFHDRLTVPTARLGPPNPLPPLFGTGNRDFQTDMSGASDEIRDNAEYGRVDSIAPYLIQDDYARERTVQDHPVIVLENEVLRATFLVGAGGRLWSLFHKPTDRELLFRNHVLQPANFALRNAWFAGGIEWNVGTIGHAPGTYAPIHAARVEHPDGTPVLRMYEFDRIRRVIYQIDAHLPAESEALFIHVRLSNPNDHDVPTYWWSNIAVEQTPGTRVITCADHAWNYAYANALRRVRVIDETAAVDATYPGRALDAADYFFDVDGEQNPWIAAVDETGAGLAQVSTPELRGRKLFIWGTSGGGERWQGWLSGPDRGYLEIQAGLARTQFEHVRLPAREDISWVEAYGRVDLSPGQAHGSWADARAAAQTSVRSLASPEILNAEHRVAESVARLPISEVLYRGSGWGALDDRLRRAADKDGLSRAETPFGPETIELDQSAWMTLVADGRFPHDDPTTFPISLEVDEGWEHYLAGRPGWIETALRGQIKAHAGDIDGARSDWLDSAAILPNVLALRNLAALSRFEADVEQACEWYDQALRLAPAQVSLIIEAIRTYLQAGRPDRAFEVIEDLGPESRANGRIRLLEAQAAVAAGELERCARLIEDGIEVADLREGEPSLHELWWDYQAALEARVAGVAVTPELRERTVRSMPVPPAMDFRMHSDGSSDEILVEIQSATTRS